MVLWQSVFISVCVCLSPVHPVEPACSSSWPVTVSVLPAESPACAAHSPAAPTAAAPPTPPALESDKERERSRRENNQYHSRQSIAEEETGVERGSLTI